jgi:outer membrane protein assembly factor BamB
MAPMIGRNVLLICQGVALASLFSTATPALSADWPQWRGPNRDGKSAETGLLKEWPAGGPALRWAATGLGAGYSAVAVVGDRIYTAGDRDGSSYVLALNAKDGKPIWSTRMGKAGAPGWGGFAGPRAIPTVAGNLVFAVDQWGEMVCLDASSGQEKWRKNFKSDFGGDRPEWGYSESPLVDGDNVMVTPGGSKGAIVALKKDTGALVWQTKEFTDPAHYSSLVIAEIGGVRQYVQLTPANVVGVAAADGKVLWQAERKGKTAVIPTPVVKDDMVYVTSGYGVGCNLFKIAAAGGKFTATQAYELKPIDNHHGGVIEVGGMIYGHSDKGGWTCQDMKTGEVKWQDGKFGKGSISYVDGMFVLRQEDKSKGTVALIEASPAGFKEHGRFDQPNHSGKNTWPHPVIAGGKLFLRDQDRLFCYDLKAK